MRNYFYSSSSSLVLSAVFFFSFFFSFNLSAQENKEEVPVLESIMKAFRIEKDAEGNELLQETDEIQPGETIEYSLIYTCNSTGRLSDINIVAPIPERTTYLADSADLYKNKEANFSIDGGNSYQAEPVKYLIRLEDGKTVEKIASVEMYTHIRWQVNEMFPAEKITLKYRVNVR